jgi:hypothetical protein
MLGAAGEKTKAALDIVKKKVVAGLVKRVSTEPGAAQ